MPPSLKNRMSSIPRTHMVNRENQLLQVSSDLHQVYCSTCAHTYTRQIKMQSRLRIKTFQDTDRGNPYITFCHLNVSVFSLSLKVTLIQSHSPQSLRNENYQLRKGSKINTSDTALPTIHLPQEKHEKYTPKQLRTFPPGTTLL